jgi:vesicle coat complex subunit
VRSDVAKTLGEIGPTARESVPALAASLQDPEQVVRWEAARALGAIGSNARDAVPALVIALGDPEAAIRGQAAWALGEFGSGAREAVPALANALKDLNPEVRSDAAWALGRIGPEAVAVLSLGRALQDSDRRVGHLAALALVELGKDGVPPLVAALNSADPDVRCEAAWALGKFGPDAQVAVPALTALLSDPEEKVFDSAATALRRISMNSGPEEHIVTDKRCDTALRPTPEPPMTWGSWLLATAFCVAIVGAPTSTGFAMGVMLAGHSGSIVGAIGGFLVGAALHGCWAGAIWDEIRRGGNQSS